MKTREESFEVLYADEPMSVISRSDLEIIERRVGSAKFKRTRLCMHSSPADRLQEMFIVQCAATYIRPHKHLDKAESMLVLAGIADILFFDDYGSITRVLRVGDYSSGSPFFYRISHAIYHSLIIRTPTFLFKEATHGPFDKGKTKFAPWSPDETNAAAAAEYTTTLRQRVEAFAGH